MKKEGLLDLNEAVQNPGIKLIFSLQTDLPSEENLDLLTPIDCELEAVSTGNVLLIQAECETKIVLECARCAEPVELDFKYTMKDEFDIDGIPSGYSHEGYAQVISEEPFQLFEKNSLIFDPYIRQGLIVNLPQRILCQENCEGVSHKKQKKSQGHPAMQALEEFVQKQDHS